MAAAHACLSRWHARNLEEVIQDSLLELMITRVPLRSMIFGLSCAPHCCCCCTNGISTGCKSWHMSSAAMVSFKASPMDLPCASGGSEIKVRVFGTFLRECCEHLRAVSPVSHCAPPLAMPACI